MREHGSDFSFLVFTFHFSNYIPSRPQWSCTSCRAHRHRMSVPGRLCGQLEMNINLLGLENKSFMVRKISNVNLSLNSEGDEWRSRRSGTWGKKKTFSRIWGNRRLILTNHSGSRVGWGGLHAERQSEGSCFFPFLLYFSCLHHECALKADVSQKPHPWRASFLQPFIFMIIYLRFKILQF